jgi:hypothetical protein
MVRGLVISRKPIPYSVASARNGVSAESSIISVIEYNSYSRSSKILGALGNFPKRDNEPAIVKKIVTALQPTDII